MVLLAVAGGISLLGYAWARFRGSKSLDDLNQFSNAAGVLTRVLTVFDALRQVAVWFANGSIGAGPLAVPVPAKSAVPPAPPARAGDPWANDAVGKELGLPPKMVAPAAVFP